MICARSSNGTRAPVRKHRDLLHSLELTPLALRRTPWTFHFNPTCGPTCGPSWVGGGAQTTGCGCMGDGERGPHAPPGLNPEAPSVILLLNANAAWPLTPLWISSELRRLDYLIPFSSFANVLIDAPCAFERF